MPMAGWIAARSMRRGLGGGFELPSADRGLPASVASRAELAPALRRSRRESGRLRIADQRSTVSLISRLRAPGSTAALGAEPVLVPGTWRFSAIVAEASSQRPACRPAGVQPIRSYSERTITSRVERWGCASAARVGRVDGERAQRARPDLRGPPDEP